MTEGLTLTAKKFMKSFQPFSSEILYLRAIPYIVTATSRNATEYGKGEGEIQSISFAKIHVYPTDILI